MDALIATLTRTEKFALELRILCGLKTQEIANAMGWTVSEARQAWGKVKRWKCL